LRDDLPLLVEALGNSVEINIDTNGTLVRSKWSDTYRCVHHFSISVDGPAGVHDSQRGAHKQTIEAIEWLIGRGVSVGTTVTVTTQSAASLKDTVEELVGIGVGIVGVNRIRRIGRYADGADFVPTAEFEATLLECWQTCERNDVVFKLSGWYGDTVLSKIDGCYLPSCFCGQFRATLRHDGYLVPCQFLAYDEQFHAASQHYEFPNVLEQDIHQAMERAPVFQDFRTATVHALPAGCEGCPHVERCNHGCRAESWLAGHDLLGPNILCERSMRLGAGVRREQQQE
jgi:radical SAM protein with 4Fe4S-binding SPASM domain